MVKEVKHERFCDGRVAGGSDWTSYQNRQVLCHGLLARRRSRSRSRGCGRCSASIETRNGQTLPLKSFIVTACREFGWNAFERELKQLLSAPQNTRSCATRRASSWRSTWLNRTGGRMRRLFTRTDNRIGQRSRIEAQSSPILRFQGVNQLSHLAPRHVARHPQHAPAAQLDGQTFVWQRRRSLRSHHHRHKGGPLRLAGLGALVANNRHLGIASHNLSPPNVKRRLGERFATAKARTESPLAANSASLPRQNNSRSELKACPPRDNPAMHTLQGRTRKASRLPFQQPRKKTRLAERSHQNDRPSRPGSAPRHQHQIRQLCRPFRRTGAMRRQQWLIHRNIARQPSRESGCGREAARNHRRQRRDHRPQRERDRRRSGRPRASAPGLALACRTFMVEQPKLSPDLPSPPPAIPRAETSPPLTLRPPQPPSPRHRGPCAAPVPRALQTLQSPEHRRERSRR